MAFLNRAFGAVVNYGNPGRIVAQRIWPGQFRDFEVTDRRSGITCAVRPGAENLFGEIWFDRDYDIPGVPLRANDVVLDLGANQGFYACYAAHQGARVFSFEPDAENVALLRKNVQRNSFPERVTIVPAAVKSYSGTTSFFTTPEIGGGMQTTTALFASSYGHRKVDDVPCVTLADQITKYSLGSIRVCKIDCEGAELEIVENLPTELAARIDGFAIEFHPDAYDPLDLVVALEKLGTHHLVMAPPKSYCDRNIIWGVSRTLLREQAHSWARAELGESRTVADPGRHS